MPLVGITVSYKQDLQINLIRQNSQNVNFSFFIEILSTFEDRKSLKNRLKQFCKINMIE